LDRLLETHYEDRKNGGFFMTSDDHEALIAREKPAQDGALPSGNAVTLSNLLRLYSLTLEEPYRVRAEKTLVVFSTLLDKSPAALSEMLLAVDAFLDTPKEIVLVSPRETRDSAEPFLSELRKQFLPNRLLIIVSEGEETEALGKVIPMVQGKTAQNGHMTAYVCERGVCGLPATDPDIFAEQLKAVKNF
jgi:uncharacterized protein YyaL (SSP411 family)